MSDDYKVLTGKFFIDFQGDGKPVEVVERSELESMRARAESAEKTVDKMNAAYLSWCAEKETIDELREKVASLEEVLSYFPKVPTQPYEKEMAKQILKLEAERDDLSIKLQRTVSAAYHALLEMSAWMGIPEKKRSAKIDELMGNVKYCAEHDLRHIEESQEIAQLRRDNEGFREALREIDRHLQFFAHVEKRYKEVGKDKVAFDKCAEIRAAHETAREAIAKFGGKK